MTLDSDELERSSRSDSASEGEGSDNNDNKRAKKRKMKKGVSSKEADFFNIAEKRRRISGPAQV